MNIGIFSGSFDPIHIGHAMIANYLSQFCGLDEVWLMPSPLNPLKQGSQPVDEVQRIEMCRIVAKKCRNVSVSDFEIYLPKPTYTYRTLSLLKHKYPNHKFHLVIGSDNWEIFTKWKNWQDIINEFPILIYPRPGFDRDSCDLEIVESVKILENAPQALISSSFIRGAIKSKKDLNYFLDSDISDYISKHNLYD